MLLVRRGESILTVGVNRGLQLSHLFLQEKVHITKATAIKVTVKML
jgi:hypothetical protein